MNNIFKFSIGILSALALAWLAFVIGAKEQFGDLEVTSSILDENESIPKGSELYPKEFVGLAYQGAKEYVSLGCTTCHTQQVRLFTEKKKDGTLKVVPGVDIARGWGKRPSLPRDYIFHNEVNLGNTRVGPDLANIGSRNYSDNWLHTHLFQPQILVPDSICPPSPFLYEVSDSKSPRSIKILNEDNNDKTNKKNIIPSIRAKRLISYLKSLNQDYELPEMAFVEVEQSEAVVVEEAEEIKEASSPKLPDWLATQISSGKEIYMKAAPGGGLCFTCHQPTGLGIPGQFPPLAGSDWVLGNKERLIKVTMHGLMGEIEVNGIKYNNVMAPPGIPPGSLTDEQIADVLTYIRNDWGNSASSVSPAEVASIRSKNKDRAPMQMWTNAELNSN